MVQHHQGLVMPPNFHPIKALVQPSILQRMTHGTAPPDPGIAPLGIHIRPLDTPGIQQPEAPGVQPPETPGIQPPETLGIQPPEAPGIQPLDLGITPPTIHTLPLPTLARAALKAGSTL